MQDGNIMTQRFKVVLKEQMTYFHRASNRN